MEKIESIDYNGYKVNIYYDQDSQNPRQHFDNLCTFALVKSKRFKGEGDVSMRYKFDFLLDTAYDLGLVKYINGDSNNKLTEKWENILHDADEELILYELRKTMFIRKINLRRQTGWICVDKEKIKEEYSCKRITKKIRGKVEQIMNAEEEVFNYWANGETYGYMIEDENGEENGGCWGFYGDDYDNNGLMEYAINEIDCEISDRKKKRMGKIKTFIKNNVPLWKREELLKVS